MSFNSATENIIASLYRGRWGAGSRSGAHVTYTSPSTEDQWPDRVLWWKGDPIARFDQKIGELTLHPIPEPFTSALRDKYECLLQFTTAKLIKPRGQAPQIVDRTTNLPVTTLRVGRRYHPGFPYVIFADCVVGKTVLICGQEVEILGYAGDGWVATTTPQGYHGNQRNLVDDFGILIPRSSATNTRINRLGSISWPQGGNNVR